LVRVATGPWLVLVALTSLLVIDPPRSVDHSVQVSVARATAALAQALPVAKGASTVIAHLGASSLLVPVILVVGLLGGVEMALVWPFCRAGVVLRGHGGGRLGDEVSAGAS